MPTIEEVLDIDGITLTRGQKRALLFRALGTCPRMAVGTRIALLNAGLLDPYCQQRATPKGIRLVTPGHVISEALRAYADAFAVYLALDRAVGSLERVMTDAYLRDHFQMTPYVVATISAHDEALGRRGDAWVACQEPCAAAGEELRSILEVQWK
jgi:hypothetical protein